MAVELRTSRPLTSYFNSAIGKGYWDIFDEKIQKFLTVRDLTSFFTTCRSIGRHKSTLQFVNAFIESRCSAEKLKQLAIDCILKPAGVSLQNRLLNSLSPYERLFLKRGDVALFAVGRKAAELDTLRQENEIVEEAWNEYYSSSHEDEKDPELEERKLLGLPVDQAQAPDLEIPEQLPEAAAGLVFPAQHVHHPHVLHFDPLGDIPEAQEAPRNRRSIGTIIKALIIILNHYDPTRVTIPTIMGLCECNNILEEYGELDFRSFARVSAIWGAFVAANYFLPTLTTTVLVAVNTLGRILPYISERR